MLRCICTATAPGVVSSSLLEVGLWLLFCSVPVSTIGPKPVWQFGAPWPGAVACQQRIASCSGTTAAVAGLFRKQVVMAACSLLSAVSMGLRLQVLPSCVFNYAVCHITAIQHQLPFRLHVPGAWTSEPFMFECILATMLPVHCNVSQGLAVCVS